MKDNYTSDMYLTPNDLNQIENKIEQLTTNIREKIYNNSQSQLRPVQVGDNLNGKTLYLSFPRNIYDIIDQKSFDDGKYMDVLKTTNPDFFINIYKDDVPGLVIYDIAISNNNSNNFFDPSLYSYYILRSEGKTFYNHNPNININKVILNTDIDIGVITSIDDDICQYIKIYDDESIIPNYTKKIWNENEIVYIQDINNIEQGIENIGKYFTKPLGWIDTKIWLGIIDMRGVSPDYFYNYPYGKGVNINSFSYIDINRWITDLNLIEQEDMDNTTIWNTTKSEYYWNEEDE